MSRETLKFVLLALVAGVFALVAMGLQFRGDGFLLSAHGARWLSAFGVGALLGLAGSCLPEQVLRPERWLGCSAGAAFGAALGWFAGGALGASAGALVGAVVGVAIAWRINGAYLAAAFCLLAAVGGLYAGSLVNAEPSTAKRWVFWAMGQIDRGLWANVLVIVSLLIGLVATRSATFTWLGLGVAVGVGGPIAFVAWWVAEAERRWVGLQGFYRTVLCVLAGGVLVLSTDAWQRYFIGGYSPSLNLPLALVGVPFLLWWAGRRLAAAVAGLAAGLFAGYATFVIQSAT